MRSSLPNRECSLSLCCGRSDISEQQSPTFLAPGTGFMEDSFSMDQQGWGDGGWFGDD